MAENLRTTKLNDGTQINYVTDRLTWSKLNTPAFCWDNNNEQVKSKNYGALYNWYTVATQKLCPIGWHVPSDRIGMNEHFYPISYRDENGTFCLLKDQCIIWTSTEKSIDEAYSTSIFLDNRQSQRHISFKKYGIAVRCVKDSR
jgi:hypothetical protein